MKHTITGKRRTKSDRIYTKLRNHITSPGRAPGERVAPMRALGDDDFLVRLEQNLGRVLRRRKPGRKRNRRRE